MGKRWYGWARLGAEEGSKDMCGAWFESETEAVEHAKDVARKLKAEGHAHARAMWEHRENQEG